jgi:CheY-like chemotaxis protein
LANAIKFTERRGWVRVMAERDGQRVLFHVIDSGRGIEQKLLPKLFDPMQKFSMPGTEGERGTGLGLPLAKEIITRHGGTIEVHSVLKKGTDFKFSLPVYEEIILVVCADEEHRQCCTDLLGLRAHAEVVCAIDGLEAINELKQHRPAVVIAEAKLVYLSGLELLHYLKGERSLNSIPFIAIANDPEIAPEIFRAAGADEVVTLPLDRGKFLPMVVRLLNMG